eukprot:4932351-Pleurochrysis_carterae.AAC.8
MVFESGRGCAHKAVFEAGLQESTRTGEEFERSACNRNSRQKASKLHKSPVMRAGRAQKGQAK